MGRCFLTFAIGLALLLVPVVGWAQAILPPNDTGYSAQELASLLPAIDKLEKVLSNYNLGSGRYFSPDEWCSLDFAAYTAGTLARFGYATRIVSAEGWPDGTHTWILVGIPLTGQTAWVPVETSPAQGKSQAFLGTIPSHTDPAGKLWFDSRYVQFDEEVALPDNIPPVAQIRVVPASGVTGREVSFLGVTSYDPDGEVLFYSWDFGDGGTADGGSVRHTFAQAGNYTVVLTVTDSRGGQASTSLTFTVREPGKSPPPPSGDCGCG